MAWTSRGVCCARGEPTSSAIAWNEFAEALLPEEVPLLKETRELMLEKHHLFLDRGNQSLSKVQEINERLAEIKLLVSDDFPLSEEEAADLRADLRDRVLKLLDIERDAISELSRILDGVPE